MATKVRVNTVSQVNTPQGGDVLVCEGILKIIPAPNGNNYLNLNGYWANPVIISETEQPEVGDSILVNRPAIGLYTGLRIEVVTHVFDTGYNVTSSDWAQEDIKSGDVLRSEYWLPKQYLVGKILALPENFSSKHRDKISEEKIKDGEKVHVLCMEYLPALDGTKCDDKLIAHNGRDEVTLYKIKPDVQQLAEEYADEIIEKTNYSSSKIHLVEAFKAGWNGKPI